ncbi:MAG: HNH endonuclease [bacterium]
MSTVVVLTKNFQYHGEVDVKKVISWIVKNKIEVIIEHDTHEIGSVNFKIKMPLVVRLLTFIGYKPKSTYVPYSGNAVFNRDNNYCQYWHYDENGNKFKYKCTINDRTIDHIIPISRGGARNSFKNTVCSCRTCNEKIKKNRTPQEAGLTLIREPTVPIRDKDSFVMVRFAFNPNKLSHRMFKELMGGNV